MILNEEKNLSLNITGKYAFPKVMRIDTSSHERTYREEVSEDVFKYYIGVSAFVKNFESGEQKQGLTMWREKMLEDFGSRLTDEYVRQTAEYGTIYTTLCNEYAIGNIKHNFDASDFIYESMKNWSLEYREIAHHNMMCDFTSFYLWAKEWQVVFHACEGMVLDRELYYGTPIDFVIEASNPENKGVKFQEYWINLKSGRDQKAEQHKSQQKWEWNAIRQTFNINPIVGVVAPRAFLKTKGLLPAAFSLQKFTEDDVSIIDLEREKAKILMSKYMATITDIKFGQALGDFEIKRYSNV